MNLVTINGTTGTLASAAGAIIAFAFGHWTEALTFLLIAFVIDIITGIYASRAEGRGLSSSIASIGAGKKGLALLVIILAHRIDILLELDAIVMTAAVYFYVANELVSITENLGRAGMPLPPKVIDIIDVLKTKGSAKKEE
ncbi:holin family protein [Paenibacillus sp. PAMC21692]|uniref:phage holin family protein n=1 Tax=Paenibacillus sp. PAMC21692 TaxID=2762320 RepID=UPI00164E731C|nr:phage holin family protein [Paenibacillus sp. PAMC21692]QNK54580.1 phage holin family protein [Paenibacillus sp. PAMC21692]